MQQKNNRLRSLYIPARLSEAIAEILSFPLTVIEAPMGYGKTTAVREGLRDKCGDLLWHRVADTSIDDAWKGFCRLIRCLDETCALSLLQLGIPNDAAKLREAVHLLENMCLSEDTVLVLDDYHLIGTEAVNRFVREITIAEIPNLHLVVIARHMDFDTLNELRLKGFLHHVTRKIFEFDKKDIRQYFRRCGISLTEEDEERLCAYTEGWISALYLVMLNYSETGSISLTTDIYKLVEETVYRPFSNEVRNFLLAMSLLGSFTPEQAIFMTGDKKAGQLAEAVIRKNAFVEYDVITRTYHMHPILTNCLNDLPEAREQRLRLCAKAGEWFEASGAYRLAMKYFSECGDDDKLLDAIEKDQGNCFDVDQDLFAEYMENCGMAAKARHPRAQLMYIMHLQMFGRLELFGRACEEFLRLLDTDEAITADIRNEMLGELEVIRSFSAYNDISKMSAYYRKAWELMKRPLTIYDTRNNWTFGAPSVLFLFYRESGMLEQHVAELYQAMPDYCKISKNHGIGGEYLMDAERHFCMGDLENAEILMHTAWLKAQAHEQTDILLGVEFLKMRIAIMKGDGDLLVRLLEELRYNMKTKNEYLCLHTVEICEEYILSLLGNDGKNQEKISNDGIFNTKLMFPAVPILVIVQGRTLLRRGDYLTLIGSLDSYLELASIFPNKLAQIYAWIYHGAANHMVFRTDETMKALRTALDMAMPDRMYMPFVENSDFILQPLRELQRQGFYPREISAILDICSKYLKAVKQINQLYKPEKKARLTVREQEVARLASDGYSNRSIGEALFISENSVKTMLKSIYAKLGINSRFQLEQHIDGTNQA
jgi:LuxR family maltose regulon positive regulatory protein